MIKFLKKNKKVFAWSIKQMPCIDPRVTYHKLDIRIDARLVKQRLRRMAPNKKMKVNKEVNRLLAVNFIKAIIYLEWVFNVVMVLKKNGNIIMNINLTNLNKALWCITTRCCKPLALWILQLVSKDYFSWIHFLVTIRFHYKNLFKSIPHSS